MAHTPIRRIASVTALALGAAVATVGLVSAGYQVLGERRDRRHFPPPGKLVDVCGRNVHV